MSICWIQSRLALVSGYILMMGPSPLQIPDATGLAEEGDVSTGIFYREKDTDFVVVEGLKSLSNGIPDTNCDTERFGDDALRHLAPTISEMEKFRETRNGWKRTIPVSGNEPLVVVVDYYKVRQGGLYIRGKLPSDDLSLLSVVVTGGLVRGHLTIPGYGDYALLNQAVSLRLIPLQEAIWSCQQDELN